MFTIEQLKDALCYMAISAMMRERDAMIAAAQAEQSMAQVKELHEQMRSDSIQAREVRGES